MNRKPDRRSSVAANATDIASAAGALIADLLSDPWGDISPSVYETGRLVTLAPWLDEHSDRVAYLLSTQQSDGSWGAADGYGLVPTLSATEAVLTTLRRGHHAALRCGGSIDETRLMEGANRGLRRLCGWLDGSTGLRTPDTPAVELIVPTLVEALNQQLDHLAGWLPTGLDDWRGSRRLLLPPSMDAGLLLAIRSRIAAGARVPQKLLHSLEVAGHAAIAATGVQPVEMCGVGASPAATAAWFGRRPSSPGHPGLRYLQAVVSRYGGPVPCGVPITVFERSMVLTTLARVGIAVKAPKELCADLNEGLTEEGAPGGAGLPPDAETTALTLLALAQQGIHRDLDCLWSYETETHFCAWPGETNPSTSVNAHVLEAIGYALSCRPDNPVRLAAAVPKISMWLRDQQLADGSWSDRWHASPYYATVCCALALHRFDGQKSAPSLRRALEWLMSSQRVDGSWGRWQGTVEETAYALLVLLTTESLSESAGVAPAAARGYAYLQDNAARDDGLPLFHDKDLYFSSPMVRAAQIAALHLAQHSPAIARTRLGT
jgi:halimadienyl-diphosphate synthase